MSSKFIAMLLLVLSSLAGSKPSALKLYESVEPHMGTLFRIKLYATDEQAAKRGFQAAFDRISRLDDELSDYKVDSELNRATKAAAIGPAHMSDDLATVLQAAEKISEDTGGAFDVTVGPLSRLWRSARKQGQVPRPPDIASALQKCGYQKLHLNIAARTMKVQCADMQLDLGGIAKGYAADEALAVLSKLGLSKSLVAASGDLAFGDAPPNERGWKIGIDSLDQSDKPFTRVLMLRNAAVSTSGATEQYLDANHQRYSHIIDPQTGMGLTNNISVTTVSKRGIRADPAATAISVLGQAKGLAFVEQHSELAAIIIDKNGSQVRTVESSRFTILVRESSAEGSNETN